MIRIIATFFVVSVASCANFYEERIDEMISLDKEKKSQLLRILDKMHWCTSLSDEPITGGDPIKTLVNRPEDNSCDQMQRVFENFSESITNLNTKKVVHKIYLFEFGKTSFNPWEHDPEMKSPALKKIMPGRAKRSLESGREKMIYPFFGVLQALDEPVPHSVNHQSIPLRAWLDFEYVQHSQWATPAWVAEAKEYRQRFPVLREEKVGFSWKRERDSIRAELARNADFIANEIAMDLDRYLAKFICESGEQWYDLIELARLGNQKPFIIRTKVLSEDARKKMITAFERYSEIFLLSVRAEDNYRFYYEGKPIEVPSALRKIRPHYRPILCKGT